MELIDKRKFAKAALDKNFKTFVVHIAALEAPETIIHPFQKVQIALLQADKAPTKILFKYLDYADIFLANLAMELLEHNGMNNHAIKLVENKQPLYRSIYSISPMKLETLKIYIKIYLKTTFIRRFKSLAGASILFEQKSDGNFCLCINY